MATFLTTPSQISLSGLSASTWTTFSSGAPAGATGIILSFVVAAGGNPVITTRMTGSSDSQTNGTAPSASTQLMSITGVNSSGQFDLFANPAINFTCWLIGYFGAEATFNSAAQVLSPTLTSSFANFTVTGSGALVAFIDCFAAGGQLFFRQNGSSESTLNYSGGQSYLVGLDGSGIFNAKNSNIGGTIYVKGYMTAGVVWHSSSISVGGSFTAGSFQNIPSGSGDPASGILGYAYRMGGASKFTVCGTGCNTSTYNPQALALQNGGQMAIVGGPAPAQINPVSATQVINETAYFVPTQIPMSPFTLYGLQPTLAQ